MYTDLILMRGPYWYRGSAARAHILTIAPGVCLLSSRISSKNLFPKVSKIQLRETEALDTALQQLPRCRR